MIGEVSSPAVIIAWTNDVDYSCTFEFGWCRNTTVINTNIVAFAQMKNRIVIKYQSCHNILMMEMTFVLHKLTKLSYIEVFSLSPDIANIFIFISSMNILLFKSPRYTEGDFMFLYRFVRRRRRQRPQILVHAITFEQLFGFLSFLARLLALTCRLPD